jgi:hypothetical protein
MKYVFYSEIYYTTWTIYRTLQKILKDLYEFLKAKDPEEIKGITHYDRQYYKDAITSIENTIYEIDIIISDCKLLEKHMTNVENF